MGTVTPEELLWTNVLALGLRDFIIASPRKSEDVEIISWFFSKEGTEGSLTWICHMLNLDELAIKEGVLKYKKKYKEIFKL